MSRDESKMKTSTHYLIGLTIFTLATVLEGVGIMRYMQRVPDDNVGITLFVVTMVAFALGAVGFFFKWVKERQDEAGGSPKGK